MNRTLLVSPTSCIEWKDLYFGGSKLLYELASETRSAICRSIETWPTLIYYLLDFRLNRECCIEARVVCAAFDTASTYKMAAGFLLVSIACGRHGKSLLYKRILTQRLSIGWCWQIFAPNSRTIFHWIAFSTVNIPKECLFFFKRISRDRLYPKLCSQHNPCSLN